MKITEIHKSVINALQNKEFIGDFKVTIHHPGMEEVELAGFKRTEVEFPYDFSCLLQNTVNEICFKIVSGVIPNGDFTFGIKGQIKYLYVPEEDDSDI
jgi:hypothetical protein